MQVRLAGLTFHAYGFILGLAAVVGIELARVAARELKFSEKYFTQLLVITSLGGVLGARLWHVATDFYLYQENWAGIFAIWNGGMSIIGGVAGAAGVLWFWAWYNSRKVAVQFADLSVFGLPVAQAIGRLGNWVNQELFGYPTALPWGIFIPVARRPLEFQSANFFHPLFAYELLLLGLASALLWLVFRVKRQLLTAVFGQGVLVTLYVLYYSLIRFSLEFLRVEKSAFLQTSLSINQVVLLFVALGCIIFLWTKRANFLRIIKTNHA